MATKKKATKTTPASDATTSAAMDDEPIDYSNPVICFNLIANYLNQANQRGAFNLGESSRIFQSVNSLATYINTAVGASSDNTAGGGGGGGGI